LFWGFIFLGAESLRFFKKIFIFDSLKFLLMPLDPNLDITLTPAQQAAIEAVLINAKNQIQSVIANPLNLSKKERQNTPSISVRREPFVQDAIEVLADQFPALVGKAITTSRAKT
jgi:hypothetical protein